MSRELRSWQNRDGGGDDDEERARRTQKREKRRSVLRSDRSSRNATSMLLPRCSLIAAAIFTRHAPISMSLVNAKGLSVAQLTNEVNLVYLRMRKRSGKAARRRQVKRHRKRANHCSARALSAA